MKKHIVMFCILASTLAIPRVHAGWFKNLAAVSIGYWGYKTTASWKSGVVHGAIAWGLCGLLQTPLRICWVQWVRKIGDPGYERIYWLMKNPFASEAAILDAIEREFKENKSNTLSAIETILEKISDEKIHLPVICVKA